MVDRMGALRTCTRSDCTLRSTENLCHGDSIYCDSNIPYYFNPKFSPRVHSFSFPIFVIFRVTILILVCILPLINRDSEKYDRIKWRSRQDGRYKTANRATPKTDGRRTEAN